MRFLIVEDDFASRRLMQAIVKEYGTVDVVVDGEEAVEAFRLAWEENDPYAVVFMDIMMPQLDGQEALKQIRGVEKQIGVKPVDEVKVIMVTALEDPKNVVTAYGEGGATSYIVKPVDRRKIRAELERIGALDAEE